jgi:hypothetical protein
MSQTAVKARMILWPKSPEIGDIAAAHLTSGDARMRDTSRYWFLSGSGETVAEAWSDCFRQMREFYPETHWPREIDVIWGPATNLPPGR